MTGVARFHQRNSKHNCNKQTLRTGSPGTSGGVFPGDSYMDDLFVRFWTFVLFNCMGFSCPSRESRTVMDFIADVRPHEKITLNHVVWQRQLKD